MQDYKHARDQGTGTLTAHTQVITVSTLTCDRLSFEELIIFLFLCQCEEELAHIQKIFATHLHLQGHIHHTLMTVEWNLEMRTLSGTSK